MLVVYNDEKSIGYQNRSEIGISICVSQPMALVPPLPWPQFEFYPPQPQFVFTCPALNIDWLLVFQLKFS